MKSKFLRTFETLMNVLEHLNYRLARHTKSIFEYVLTARLQYHRGACRCWFVGNGSGKRIF